MNTQNKLMTTDGPTGSLALDPCSDFSGHTPGEWSVPHFADPSCKCQCRYVLCEGYMGAICTVHVGNDLPIGEGGNDDPPADEAAANARLIAAAPRLLAGLQKARTQLIAHGHAETCIETALRTIDEALCPNGRDEPRAGSALSPKQ